MDAVVFSVASAWIGAIGIGLITVCLRLNNNVLRLTAAVEDLAAETNRNRDAIHELFVNHAHHAERLAVLESS
jgi:hypothetical protein